MVRTISALAEMFQPLAENLPIAIADYIDYYNRRIQAKTKWMPPVKFQEASMMRN